MRSLTFLGGAILGAVAVASVLHDGFREASKKLINTVSEQLSKSIDEATEIKQEDKEHELQ